MNKNKRLTELELKVINCMYRMAEYRLQFPTLRDVAEELGIHFTSVHEVKKQLARKGIIFENE